ncbi:MAG: HAMP domain-containing histidine kinase [Xanthomonadales bacterium]|nr:HAMP domain-containing histidine kinase [Xanthomonadales bacterium]
MKTILATRREAAERARRLTETLAWLRLSAVAGQSLTVLVVAFAMELPIRTGPLALGIAVLAAFALFAFWRLAQPREIGAAEAFGHVAVDTAVLAWLLFWSGGATNPFVSLLVVPIGVAAAALPLRYVVAVALLAAAAYAMLIPLHVDLPPLRAGGPGFDLHVAGSAINFAVIAGLLGFFIARLARRLRHRELEIQLERERALRDEGILAIATQAAGTAHELNTPLSTIRTLLAELRREQAGNPALAEDLALLSSQAERCRIILQELVAVGRRQLAGTPERIALGRFVAECENQFRLLRPEVELATHFDTGADSRSIQVVPSLRHALINLLSNAADASLAAGEPSVELAIDIVAGGVEFGIRDHGSGIAAGAGAAFQTSKHDGLGLGLALANATAERLGGELIASRAAGGGLLQRLRIPLAGAENARP